MTEQKQIIVSLTSFPAAIQYAVLAVRSVLSGSVKPDKMVLYLTFSQFSNEQIPEELQELMDKDPVFEVRDYKDDIRSYRKLIPALIDFPNDIIVTIDDDILYKKNMLRDLLRLHKRYPEAIIGHRVRHLKLYAPYFSWKRYKEHRYILKSLRPKFANMQTGVGGVLYPPNSLKPEMLDSKVFMEIAPTVDDVWFWAAAVANGTKIAPVPFGDWKLNQIGKPSEISLHKINLLSGTDVNREVLEKILEKYPVVRRYVEAESSKKISKLIKKGFGRLGFLLRIKWAERKFNGKPLKEVQNDIKNVICSLRYIYLRDEVEARKMADNWNDSVQKPNNIRYFENAVPVVLCANEKYAPYSAVMLQSLMENSNPQRSYHFFIFGRDFSEKTIKLLTFQAEKIPNCTLDIVNTQSILDALPITGTKGLSVDAFARLFIPYWLDKYEKVIYLDSDMLARSDIAELYDIDIGNYCVGMTPCAKTNMYLKQCKYGHFMKRTAAFMYLDNWEYYINSGVLVINPKKFCQKFPYQELIKFTIYYTNRYYKRFNDQDVLALLVKDDYFALPPQWNYCWNLPIDGVSYRPSSPDVKITHLTGGKKPWHKHKRINNNPDTLAYRKLALTVPLFIENFK